MGRPFDPSLPLAEATALTRDWYVDPSRSRLERDRLFRDQWMWVGRREQVSSAGQYLTAEVGGEPIVIVRDEAGELRAFYNVCRHRAARVACGMEGQVTRFRCRYHGWTYDLRGDLCGLPEMDGVQNFNRQQMGLPPVNVACWGPWVFVHLGTPQCDLEDYLKPLPERIAPYAIERLVWRERRAYDLACNWKIYVDNYLDGGYHVNTLHKSLASVLDYSEYKTYTYAYCSEQTSPLKQPDAAREDASAAPVRAGDSAAYWWLFPNLMVNVYAGIMDTNLVIPLAADRCRVVFDFYFDPEKTPEYCRQSIDVSDRIQDEDVEICEEVQRGVASQSYWAGRYSVRREVGVYHFHRLLVQQLESSSSSHAFGK